MEKKFELGIVLNLNLQCMHFFDKLASLAFYLLISKLNGSSLLYEAPDEMIL